MIICKQNDYNIIYRSCCIRDLYNTIETLASDYIDRLQIVPKIFYKKSLSSRWGKAPEGYFLVSRPSKITIYKKSILKGVLYNSTVVSKVISFILIKPIKCIFTPEDYTEDDIDIFMNRPDLPCAAELNTAED